MKKIEYFVFKKKDRLITIQTIFWIVTVQDCSKTISANSVCPLGKPNSSNVIDME